MAGFQTLYYSSRVYGIWQWESRHPAIKQKNIHPSRLEGPELDVITPYRKCDLCPVGRIGGLRLVRWIKSELLRADLFRIRLFLIQGRQTNAKQLHVSIARRRNVADPSTVRRHAEPGHVLVAFEVKERRGASTGPGHRVKRLLILFPKCLKDDVVGSR